MSRFVALLSQYVEASGMKQVAIASAAGITYSYLHLLLVGKRNPSEQVVSALATALRLTPEQTGELLASAGYAPSVVLLASSPTSSPEELPSDEVGVASSLAHRWYRLGQEVPASTRTQFFEEMAHLQDYVRYKYILSGGACLMDLQPSSAISSVSTLHRQVEDFASLDLLASLVGELCGGDEASLRAETSEKAVPRTEEMLTALDELLGGIISGEFRGLKGQPYLGQQILSVLRQGVPWEIRRRATEALPGLGRIDMEGALHVAELLRLDWDEKHGADIRRRVIEALPALFEIEESIFPRLLDLLAPQKKDDIFVANATLEACGDIQSIARRRASEGRSAGSGTLPPAIPVSSEFAGLAKIQRQVLVGREGSELEYLQFSLALYNLLCSPETLLLSIQEGTQSEDKRMQLVAVRYLERVLPLRPLEALQVYQQVLTPTTSSNVRRTVARALPALLKVLGEASLPARTLARAVVSRLAQDHDIHIRRTVSDYAMQMFAVDREFLLTILRFLYQDRDEAIRQRLQPVALRLAQVWLSWYAETAGLVRTSRRKSTPPFGE